LDSPGLAGEVKHLRQRLLTLQRVQRQAHSAPDALEVLRQLSLRSPLGVWLDRVSYDRLQGLVRVEGWALSRVAAEDWLGRLRMASDLCREVHLLENRPATFRGQRAYHVQLLMKLGGPPLAGGAAPPPLASL
jgi:hypothetical protein